ncbi:hypothetical protein MZM54_03885 [[Brevibacterium] frigoritolerans]|nr:hypothetical protein [Peribacillus frigoritolerans]
MANGLKLELDTFFYEYGIASSGEVNYKWIFGKLLNQRNEWTIHTREGRLTLLSLLLTPGVWVTEYKRYFPDIVPAELEKDYEYMLSLCTIDVNSNKKIIIRPSYGNNFINFINTDILTYLSSEWELYKIFANDELRADMARNIVTSHFSTQISELIKALEYELPKIIIDYLDEINQFADR